MNGSAEARPAQRLDLRGLHPPEPMQRALEAVEALGRGDTLEIITDREPLLLYRELARRGHPYVSETCSDGFHTAIRRTEGDRAP